MHDNNEDTIQKKEEGSEEMIRERKNNMREGIGSWKLNMSKFSRMSKKMPRPKAPHLCIPKDVLDQSNTWRLQAGPIKLNLSDEML